MLDPFHKTTIARLVHTLDAVDRSYWEHNSHELTRIGPMAIVPSFQSLPPITTQRASGHIMSEGDSTLEFPWVLGLGSLRPVAPIEVTADRWSTSPSLVFPSMDPVIMPAWKEVREVNVPQPEASYS
jgi:hypothetical protein